MNQGKERGNKRRFRRRLFIGATLLLPLVIFGIFFSYSLGIFYDHQNRFNTAVESMNSDSINDEIRNLNYYYGVATRLRMQSLADKYYQRSYMYGAVLDYSRGNYSAVIKNQNLRNNIEDHMVSQLIASAKARQARAMYREAKTDAVKEKLVDSIMLDACADFKRALENGPGPGLYFEHSFNWDLCSDEDSTRRFLEGPDRPAIVLEYGPSDEPGEGEPEDGDEDQRLEPTEPGGGSGIRKRG